MSIQFDSDKTKTSSEWRLRNRIAKTPKTPIPDSNHQKVIQPGRLPFAELDNSSSGNRWSLFILLHFQTLVIHAAKERVGKSAVHAHAKATTPKRTIAYSPPKKYHLTMSTRPVNPNTPKVMSPLRRMVYPGSTEFSPTSVLQFGQSLTSSVDLLSPFVLLFIFVFPC